MRCRQEADEKDRAMGMVGGTDAGWEQRCRTPVPVPKGRGLPGGLDWDVSWLGPPPPCWAPPGAGKGPHGSISWTSSLSTGSPRAGELLRGPVALLVAR